MKKPDKLIMKILEAQRIAGEMKRVRTIHALHEVIRVAGWELADILEGKQKIGDKK